MINKPIFFERNRVFRVYQGGKLFADFFGDDSTDDNYPEEWIASSVRALNQDTQSEFEGISKVANSGMRFDELLLKYQSQMLGPQNSIGFLVKLLDSAIRLPVQAHPDKAFSQKYFHSNYGKAEGWVVLATRPSAKIYFGFRDGVTKEQFTEAIKVSETDKHVMEKYLCEIDVKVGDVFFIPAKVVHAIGYGCLILEVQEPTDFTIQPEHWCGDYKLSDYEMYLGLEQDAALSCFDFSKAPTAKKIEKLMASGDGYFYEQLICEGETDCFTINKIVINGGEFILNHAPAIFVVISGSGYLVGETYTKPISKGDYFFLPYSLGGKFKIMGEKLEVIECF